MPQEESYTYRRDDIYPSGNSTHGTSGTLSHLLPTLGWHVKELLCHSLFSVSVLAWNAGRGRPYLDESREATILVPQD